eukprot:GHVN01072390.1.p1 GENE.GHVN01072390.1~~GHVN01072390.1.p1  ORF type:complete len:122 (+),score=68.15 GHVN01072390.1:146-511(+)
MECAQVIPFQDVERELRLLKHPTHSHIPLSHTHASLNHHSRNPQSPQSCIPQSPHSRNLPSPHPRNPQSPDSRNPQSPHSRNPQSPHSRNPQSPHSRNPQSHTPHSLTINRNSYSQVSTRG